MDLFYEIDLIQEHFDQPISVETYIDEAGQSHEYTFDTKKEIAIINFMSASRYLSGDYDNLGKKPFFNVLNQLVDLEVRATDIDTSNIVTRHTSPEYEVQALLVSKELFNWFDENDFAETINDWNETGTRYGNSLFKRSYVDGKLKITTPRWSAITFNQFDIENGAIIEHHNLSPIDLDKKRGSWDNIDEAIELLEQRFNKDETNERVLEILEVEAELPRSIFTGDENDTGYSLQHHFVVPSSESSGGLVLFSEELKDSNYIYYGRKKLDGRGWALGVVEQGKESQAEINLAKIWERRAMEFGSKKVFITTDSELADVNVLNDLETGDIILQKQNTSTQELSTMSNSIPAFQNYTDSWLTQIKATLSAFDSVTGDTMPSGTAFRLGLLQAKQASSIFEYLKERRGQVLKRVVRDWILPEIASKIDSDHILSADFSPEEIDFIHERFARSIANKKIKEMIESGLDIDGMTYRELIDEAKDNLPKSQRQFLTIKKGDMKDALKHIKVHITDEAENAEAKVATLSTFLQMAMQDVNGAVFEPTAAQDMIREIARLTNTNSINWLAKPSKKEPVAQGLTGQMPPMPTQNAGNQEVV